MLTRLPCDIQLSQLGRVAYNLAQARLGTALIKVCTLVQVKHAQRLQQLHLGDLGQQVLRLVARHRALIHDKHFKLGLLVQNAE